MKKGQLTRQLILEKTAPVFNKLGYGNTTLDDIKAATGLEKGGIYRHFSSKEEIACEAFDYACMTTIQHLLAAPSKVEQGIDKINAFLAGFFRSDIPIEGGCPVINTAVENDDGNLILKKKSIMSYKRLIKELSRFIELAKDEGSLMKDLDTERMAIFLLSTVEGGLIARNLMGKNSVGEGILKDIQDYLETKAPSKSKKR